MSMHIQDGKLIVELTDEAREAIGIMTGDALYCSIRSDGCLEIGLDRGEPPGFRGDLADEVANRLAERLRANENEALMRVSGDATVHRLISEAAILERALAVPDLASEKRAEFQALRDHTLLVRDAGIDMQRRNEARSKVLREAGTISRQARSRRARRPQRKLEDLLAQCDFSVELTPEETAERDLFINSPSVGRECGSPLWDLAERFGKLDEFMHGEWPTAADTLKLSPEDQLTLAVSIVDLRK